MPQKVLFTHAEVKGSIPGDGVSRWILVLSSDA
jgi:hypothetical protein